jgi:hypothetical protein
MSEVRYALTYESSRKTDFNIAPQSEVPNTGGSRNGKELVSTPISLTSTKRNSVDESTSSTHRRTKRSLDSSKQSDRLSLFGSISGTIGKSRKPAPRYSAG